MDFRLERRSRVGWLEVGLNVAVFSPRGRDCVTTSLPFSFVLGYYRASIQHPSEERDARCLTCPSSTRGEAAAGYLTTYLLPLIGATAVGYSDLFGLAMYGLVLWAVYVRSSLAVINPTIYLWGGT